MNRIFQKMIFSCKKSTELVEKKSIIGLPLLENMRLKLHIAICNACKRYEAQSKIIDLILEQIYKSQDKKTGLSTAKKNQIITLIKKK